jgi:F0F1-type ATP synthase membrane subunit b/b'
MEQIVNQLGELFLAAVPTVIVVFLFYLFLKWSFFGPIERVLHERAAKIEGAHKERESLRAAAREKDHVYREALRKARMEILAEQEAARRVMLDERGAAVQQARVVATEEVHAARARIGAEMAAAKGDLEASSKELAEEIALAILTQRPLPSTPAGGVQ